MKNISSHAHKTEFWYFLGVLFKISDEHRHPFYIWVPPEKEQKTVIFSNFPLIKIWTSLQCVLLAILVLLSTREPPWGFGKQRNMMIYFKGTRDILGLVSEGIEQGISLRKLWQSILGSSGTNPEAAALEEDWAPITERWNFYHLDCCTLDTRRKAKKGQTKSNMAQDSRGRATTTSSTPVGAPSRRPQKTG